MKNIKTILSYLPDFLTAAMILGLPFYGSCIYYFLTGQPLEF